MIYERSLQAFGDTFEGETLTPEGFHFAVRTQGSEEAGFPRMTNVITCRERGIERERQRGKVETKSGTKRSEMIHSRLHTVEAVVCDTAELCCIGNVDYHSFGS